MRRQVIFGLMLMSLAFAGAMPARAETCYSDWSEAGPIVKAEGLVSAKEIQELARSQVDGKLIKITLCEDGGQYSYKLVFDKPDGEVVDMTVDARTPFAQP